MDSKNLSKINKILDTVNKKISPTKDVMLKVQKIVDTINGIVKKKKIDASCIIGGSFAKGTFLKDDFDVDLFVRFNMSYKNDDISEILATVLKNFKPTRIHGSRDYFQFKNSGISYEVIPVISIHASNYKDALNVTDMSPEHVNWVNTKIGDNNELRREIRITKQFCKANNVYGAESYIKGFSGHILDILIIYYGSFINLVKKFSEVNDLSNPIIIDIEKHMKNPLKELNSSKLSPLIIIDPIQKDRNAAAALSKEKLSNFISACKEFLNNPDIEYFTLKKFDVKPLLKQKNIVFIDVKTLDGSKDIVGTKVLTVYEDLQKQLILYGFKIIDGGWNFKFDKRSALIYLIFDDLIIEKYYEHTGPPVFKKDACKEFAAKNPETYVRSGRMYAKVKREYYKASDYISYLLKQDFISRKVFKAKVLSVKDVKKL